ncbi:hypothetical protein DPS16_22220 [Salmonella enterica subsp. enterica serovar Enteritidis]|nr:hypothetical protein [Salmonella enterica subsp. enterica serovar Enteritidis]
MQGEFMTIAERLEQKGRKEKALEIAVRLQKMELPFEKIFEATGITEEELKRSTHRQSGDHI